MSEQVKVIEGMFKDTPRRRKRARGTPEHDVGRATIEELVPLVDTTNWFYIAQVTVGVAVVRCPAYHYPTKGVSVKALSTNAGIMYVGHNGNVTAANGYELLANQAIELEVECTSDIYFIASAADQVVCLASV
jgi:hypothetical protein